MDHQYFGGGPPKYSTRVREERIGKSASEERARKSAPERARREKRAGKSAPGKARRERRTDKEAGAHSAPAFPYS
jgi:hypothetical protein